MTQQNELANLHPMVINRQELRDTFRSDVLEGLAMPRKRIPPKHLYDARGSELFDEICEVQDYYPTRTERDLLEASSEDIARAIGTDITLVEPGAGSGQKAEDLLATLDAPHAFVPIEISRSALAAAAERIAERFPDVEIFPVCDDFTMIASLPDDIGGANRALFFPGSTIGNLEPAERRELLSHFASCVSKDGLLLIGFDLEKDLDALRRAYNDSDGVTAEFNLNLLDRINRELDGDFDREAFEHDAPWSPERKRVEMHLVSKKDQRVTVAGQTFEFKKGESIHTESSHKFTPESFDAEAATAGFTPVKRWVAPRNWYCVTLYRASA
ncbi:MAG: L-histidine N(alpha)-methyltransferase [Phycisphaerales bacterium]